MKTTNVLLAVFLLFTLINSTALIYLFNQEEALQEQTSTRLTKLDRQKNAINAMSQAVRDRALLSLRMSYITDSFEREDLASLYSFKAAVFLQNKQRFEQMTTAPEIIVAFNEVTAKTNYASQLLNQSLDLMREDNLTQAEELLFTAVLPRQDEIIAALEKLSNQISNDAASSIQQDLQQVKRNKLYFVIMTFLLFAQLLIGIFILSIKFHRDAKKIQEIEKVNHVLIDTAFDAIISVSEKGLISGFNKAAEKLFGFKADYIIGHKLFDLIPGRFRSLIDQLLNAIDTNNGSHPQQGMTTEIQIINSHSNMIKVLASISPTGLTGQHKYSVILHDISAIKAAEKELQQQKKALDEHSLVVITDTNGSIMNVNDLFCQVSGYERQELMGKNHRIFSSETYPAEYWEKMYKTLFSGNIWRHEVHNIGKHGQSFWVDTSVVPFKNSLGKIKNFVAISTDISKRVEIEQALTRHQQHLKELVKEQTSELIIARDEAEAANREKSRFLTNMSHELRTPIHAIKSFSELGLNRIDSGDQEKLKNYFSRINESSARLMGLVENLLDLSQMETDKIQYNFDKNSFTQALTKVLIEQSNDSQMKNLSIHVDALADDQLAAFDAKRIMQVMNNLISNAIRHSPLDGIINIHCQLLPTAFEWGLADAPHILFRIADQGIGIPEAEFETIFDHFIQSSKTLSNAGGKGLGLSICKGIIKSHCGNIRAYNNDAGATFEFVIPVDHQDDCLAKNNSKS